MRIGLNGTAFDALSSGARDRFLHLYGEAARRRPEDEFLVYSPAGLSLAPLFRGPVAAETRTPLSPEKPLFRFLKSGGYFRRRLAGDGADLFVTDHFPVVEGRGTRTLLTIHDLRFLTLPGEGSALRRTYFRARFARVASRARLVVTVSKAMAREIEERLGLAGDRVAVVENGVAGEFVRAPPEEVDALRRRLSLPSQYLLHVGVMERRKNLGLLLTVLAADPGLPPLVLAGRGGPEADRLAARARDLGVADRVLDVGYVPDEDLPTLFSGAAVVVVPSRYEGFGLPVLQGFATGTPVVSANAPALEEVAGDAALLADPDDPGAWTTSIRRALEDTDLRGILAAAGRERARARTWARAAERFVEILDRLREP